MPPESLGWLLIDEAGQALPQAAAGALMRAKRAVIVGDPLQIEPVVTMSPMLVQKLAGAFGVDHLEWTCSAEVVAPMRSTRSRRSGRVLGISPSSDFKGLSAQPAEVVAPLRRSGRALTPGPAEMVALLRRLGRAPSADLVALFRRSGRTYIVQNISEPRSRTFQNTLIPEHLQISEIANSKNLDFAG
jgi:AAA domain-containing protein